MAQARYNFTPRQEHTSTEVEVLETASEQGLVLVAMLVPRSSIQPLDDEAAHMIFSEQTE